MDKKLVGKWYKEEEGETINIFDSAPFRMKMSFSSIGYYNFEPNIIYEHDGYFCYEVNDEYNRRVYYVKVINNNLEGYYTQYGKQTPIKYVKLSDVPEDEPYRFEPTEVYVPESNKTRLEILTQYANYDQTNEYGCSISFVFENKTHEILNKYHYYDYVKDLDNSNDELVFKLLDFVCDNFGHDGAKGLGHSTSIETLIEFWKM